MEEARRVVCVIDDDDAVRESLHLLLELHQATVISFSSPVEFLRSRPADAGLLLVDYQMPEMTGLALLIELRKAGIDTPAILITANARPKAADLAHAGVIALLRKPVQDEQLVMWMERIFNTDSGSST